MENEKPVVITITVDGKEVSVKATNCGLRDLSYAVVGILDTVSKHEDEQDRLNFKMSVLEALQNML